MSNRSKRYSKRFTQDAVAYVFEHPELSTNTVATNLGVSASAG